MNKIIVAAMLLAVFSAAAQKIDASKVPADVKTAFTKKFSGISDVKWENEKGNYEANFKQNDHKMSALFDARGTWLETETRIKADELPAAAREYIAREYKGEKIKEAAKLKMASGEDNYEAEVKETDLIFDTNGKFIKKMKD